MRIGILTNMVRHRAPLNGVRVRVSDEAPTHTLRVELLEGRGAWECGDVIGVAVDQVTLAREVCGLCGGLGRVADAPCDRCLGAGVVT